MQSHPLVTIVVLGGIRTPRSNLAALSLVCRIYLDMAFREPSVLMFLLSTAVLCAALLGAGLWWLSLTVAGCVGAYLGVAYLKR